MAKRAARVDGNQTYLVNALRKMGYKVRSLATAGDGVPDLLVGTPDKRLVLLEVKDPARPPSARKLTPAEVAFHTHWSGYPVAVVTDVDSALAALRAARGWVA